MKRDVSEIQFKWIIMYRHDELGNCTEQKSQKNKFAIKNLASKPQLSGAVQSVFANRLLN